MNFNVFKQDQLAKILLEEEGVLLVSKGRPRDAFVLGIDVPHWVSGFGGKYEMRHTNVPKGVMIAVGNIEELDFSDLERLAEQLKHIDIYPTGHSGDFSSCRLENLEEWFNSRSFINNEANPQEPILKIRKLTDRELGNKDYIRLINYLSINMNLFKNPDKMGVFVLENLDERKAIVQSLLEGLSTTVRYTRKDDNARAYQLIGQVLVEKSESSAINLFLREEAKILVVRPAAESWDITPLDRAMIGNTYVTADGKPLGDRAQIDIGYIRERVREMSREEHFVLAP